MSHTEVLQCSADDIWGACKHADDILPHLMPDFFTKSVFLQGHGEPGSIRIVKLGPAAPHAAEVKERMDTFDDATKTLGYTVLEGDRRYSSFSAQMKFVPAGKTTEAIWTATYEPVGDMGPPEHIKQIVVLVFKSLERAMLSRKTLSQTIALEDGITKGLGGIIECVHAFLHLGGMGGGCTSCCNQLYMCEIVAMNSSQLPIR
jgi:hypothetical protein